MAILRVVASLFGKGLALAAAGYWIFDDGGGVAPEIAKAAEERHERLGLHKLEP